MGFCIGKEGRNVRADHRKAGSVRKYTFQEWVGCKKCLKKVALVSSPPPVLPQDPTDNEKKVWDYHMADLLRSEHILDSNLNNMF